MMAKALLNVQQYFAALYAHADVEADPTSGGRQMGGHFATRTLNDDGSWRDLMANFNSSADVSPTAAQMPRLLGLAQASKVFRAMPELAQQMPTFTNGGNEIAVGTIGDASTSEGLFWEAMNAACVLEIPMLMSVWDDGYGISVPKKYQTVKESISGPCQASKGRRPGLVIYRVRGWITPTGGDTKRRQGAAEKSTCLCSFMSRNHPASGSGTSGSHERYKRRNASHGRPNSIASARWVFLQKEGAA